jgi:hypothetical protein
MRPFELVRLGAKRCLIIGRAENPTALTEQAMTAKPQGGTDGYFAIVERE